MKRSQITLFGVLLFFSLVMGSLVHELYHVFELGMYGAEVEEICVLGSRDGAVGWVKKGGETHEIRMELPFAFGETIPCILELVVTVWCFFGLVCLVRRQ